MIGQTVEILLPENLRARHNTYRTEFDNRPGDRHFGTGRDFNGRRKDGSEFAVEVGLKPIQIDNESIMLCAVIDIEARKRLERMQDEFIATVSHELRTPMTSIAGTLGLLAGGAVGTLPPSAAHLIEIAQAGCQRLIRLVNDILDIKKLEAGQMTFGFQRCDVRALLQSAIDANCGYADGHGVRLRLDGELDAIEVYVDPDRFVQAITNLLSNAIRFSPRGQNVAITVGRRGGNVRITVRDHGSGIPASFKPRVFEKFMQATGANGQQKGGTAFHVDLPDAEQAAHAMAALTANALSAHHRREQRAS